MYLASHTHPMSFKVVSLWGTYIPQRNLLFISLLLFWYNKLFLTNFQDPFGERRGRFQYSTLLKQLKRLKTKLKANGIPEIPENSKTTESDDVSSISESEEGSPASEGEE